MTRFEKTKQTTLFDDALGRFRLCRRRFLVHRSAQLNQRMLAIISLACVIAVGMVYYFFLKQ